MKHLLFLLFLIVYLPSFSQNYIEFTNEKRTDELLNKVRQKQASEDDRLELQKIANFIQDKGQDPNENQKQYKKSLANIDKAIVLFDALNDTLSVANNRKFKGYLLGRYGKFTEAKRETKTAIDLYRLKNMNAEIAVSQFDLARMFEFENRTDSAIYFADQSRAFWKTKNADLRVLIIDNMLVSLLLKSHEPEKAKMVQQESALLISKPGIQWQAVIDFYFTSMLLYKTINDIGVASDYQRFYDAKIEELRRTGIVAKSYYENERQ